MELLCPLLLVLVLSQVGGMSIDTKLDLPSLTSDGVPFPLDSSLSTTIEKTVHEINFFQVTRVSSHKSQITITDTKGCPYSKELCKFYFAPSEASLLEEVEDLIKGSKGNLSTDVPVIQGNTVTDKEKLQKELSLTIKTTKKPNVISHNNNNGSDDVPELYLRSGESQRSQ